MLVQALIIVACIVGSPLALSMPPAVVAADTESLPIWVKPIEGMNYASAVAIGVPLGALVPSDKQEKRAPSRDQAPERESKDSKE